MCGLYAMDRERAEGSHEVTALEPPFVSWILLRRVLLVTPGEDCIQSPSIYPP